MKISWRISIVFLTSIVFISLICGCVQNSATPEIPLNTTTAKFPAPSLSIQSEPITPRTMSESQTTANDVPIKITLNSAIRTKKIRDTDAPAGNDFVIINMTVSVLGNGPYFINGSTVKLIGGYPQQQRMNDKLISPLNNMKILPHETKTGEIVFSTMENTKDLTLKCTDARQTKVFLTQDLGNLPYAEYPPSKLTPDVLASKNFTYVVEQLDTPEKVTQYAKAKFTYGVHGRCIAFSPEEFFTLQQGDCKDYSAFISYVLAAHGYDAKVFAFHYRDMASQQGHAVALFTDTDGRLKYASTPDVSIIRTVASVDDLLAKEIARLDASKIDAYSIYPAGSLQACAEGYTFF